MTTFLIAHTNSAGSGIAQATIVVMDEILREDETAEQNARVQFRQHFPERHIHTIGVKDS